jgi:hypothetical protein
MAFTVYTHRCVQVTFWIFCSQTENKKKFDTVPCLFLLRGLFSYAACFTYLLLNHLFAVYEFRITA